jgi:murein DD-endopeptidase MepM/ murein hydrolase activator NlpD
VDAKGLDGLRLKRPALGAVIAGFGVMTHPLLKIPKFHHGLDFGSAYGEPVEAAAQGRVFVATHEGEYGNVVRIDHGGGLVTLYSHLSGISVQAGDCVSQGAVIGFVGATGLTAGPQMHFEVLVEGKQVDPAPFITAGQQ